MPESESQIPPDDGEFLFQLEKRTAKKRSRRWKIIGAIALLAVATIGLSGAGILEKWRTRQAKQMAGSAAELFDAGRQREAMVRVQSAWRMRPDEPEVMRAMARILDSSGDPQSLPVHVKLVASAEASDTDRQNFVRSAVQLGRADLAVNAAQTLAASGDKGFARLVAGVQLRAKGEAANAEKEHRRESGKFNPDSRGRPAKTKHPAKLRSLKRCLGRRNSGSGGQSMEQTLG